MSPVPTESNIASQMGGVYCLKTRPKRVAHDLFGIPCPDSFPQYGKLFRDFSTVWKIFPRVFHSMENTWKRPGLWAFLAVIRGLLSGARGAPCEP